MATFEGLLARAETMLAAEPARSDYWHGYLRGLRRGHYGDRFGTDEEHQRWLAAGSLELANGYGDGYHDGLQAETQSGVN